ncbi:MAG: hypothetical protein M0Q91_05870 [Methanoregula sp.]|jgi:hypothetical protein|nr:hypothetical protein [Methanoregula sp.]
MNESLTPDEDVVFREFTRLDVEPNQIPVELYAGFLERLANSCNMSLQRARLATQGLIDKGKFDVIEEGKEERIQNEREIIRDLLLNDTEIQELLKKIVAEMCANKT